MGNPDIRHPGAQLYPGPRDRDGCLRGVCLTESRNHAAGRHLRHSRRRSSGHRSQRLDSGDLAGLARDARRMLDAAGLKDVTIFASSGLDEYQIAHLVAIRGAHRRLRSGDQTSRLRRCSGSRHGLQTGGICRQGAVQAFARQNDLSRAQTGLPPVPRFTYGWRYSKASFSRNPASKNRAGICGSKWRNCRKPGWVSKNPQRPTRCSSAKA